MHSTHTVLHIYNTTLYYIPCILHTHKHTHTHTTLHIHILQHCTHTCTCTHAHTLHYYVHTHAYTPCFTFSCAKLPLQATKLTKACQKWRQLGHEVRARPYTYQNVKQLDLDSFLNYMSSLKMTVSYFSCQLSFTKLKKDKDLCLLSLENNGLGYDIILIPPALTTILHRCYKVCTS